MNDFVLSTELLTEFELENPKDYKVNAIVLLVNNSRFNEGYSLSMLGKQMKDWVRESVSYFDCRFVDLQEKDNPLEVIKPFIKDEDYTIVLFSDTPLLKSSTVLDLLDYATTKKLDFCKLPRGFIINSAKFKNEELSITAEPTFCDKEEFFTVFDYKTLATAKKVLKDRIMEKHLKNKVIFHSLETVYIESNVEIASYVEIFANNSIKGNSKISEGCVLKENNIIENSLILNNCEITSSVIKNARIEQDSVVGPFAIIENNLKKENN